MKKWKFSFGLPTNVELGLVILAFLLFMVMDASQNILQGHRGNFGVMAWWGITALASWWIFFVAYNIVLMIVYARALRSRKTSYKYDTIAGIVGFVGLLFILGAGIGAMYFGASEPLSWMGGLGQITAYHLGIFFNLMTLLYFIVSE